MICLLPHSLPSVSSTGDFQKADGRGTGGDGEGAKSYDGEKARSSINNSVLSVVH
jgi:hypothetical protein